MLWKSVIYLGLASLLHAAFSAAQHRSYSRLVNQESLTDLSSAEHSHGTFFHTDLPLDIIVQALGSAIVVLVALIIQSGPLKEIRTLEDLNRKPQTLFDNQPSLYVFNHRGRILR